MGAVTDPVPVCAVSVRARAAGRVFLAIAALLLLPTASAQIFGQPEPPGGTPDPTQPDPPALPDLAVYSLGVSPVEPDSAHPFRVCAEFQDYGNGEPGPFSAILTLDDEEIISKRYAAFPPAGDVLCGDTLADAGWHAIDAVIDYEHEVQEMSEANNQRSLNLLVGEPPLPDLALDLTVMPDPPRRGEAITFHARVTNAGAAASAASVVNFTYDGKYIARRNVPALAAGASYAVAASLDADVLREGPHEVAVEADTLRQVAETNEENNVDSATFTLPRIPKPDLVVGNVTLPGTIRDGHRVNVTVTVKNVGDKRASPFVARVLLDNRTTLGLPRFESGLSEFSESNVTVVWAARAPGNHSIRVVIDEDKRVSEENESNNFVLRPFEVRPASDVPQRPDLVVDRALEIQDLSLPDPPVNFTAVVRNAGAVSSGPFEVSFFVDGEPAGSYRAISVPPGAAIAATSSWRGLLGPHALTVVVDPTDGVRESNESNNEHVSEFIARQGARATTPPPPPREDPDPTTPTGPAGPRTPAERDGGAPSQGQPNLRVFAVTPLIPFRNRTTGELENRLAVEVRNEGLAIETRPFTLYFYLDDELAGERRYTQAVRPEGRVLLSSLIDVGPGPHEGRVHLAFDGENPLNVPLQQQLGAKFELPRDSKFLPAPSFAGVLLALAAAFALARSRRM